MNICYACFKIFHLLSSLCIQKLIYVTACRDKLPLPRLNGPVSCHITSSCSGIECCLDVKPLQRSFHAYVLLDACSNRIKLGIENYNLDTVYFDFKFGKFIQSIRIV